MVDPGLMATIEKLPIDARIELVEAIWDTITQVPESEELPQALRDELDRRWERHRTHPHEVMTWDEVEKEIDQDLRDLS